LSPPFRVPVVTTTTTITTYDKDNDSKGVMRQGILSYCGWLAGWLAGNTLSFLQSFSCVLRMNVLRIYSYRIVQTDLAELASSVNQPAPFFVLSFLLPSIHPSFLSFRLSVCLSSFTSLFRTWPLFLSSLPLSPSPSFSLAFAVASGGYVASGAFSLLNARLPLPRALATILFVLRSGGVRAATTTTTTVRKNLPALSGVQERISMTMTKMMTMTTFERANGMFNELVVANVSRTLFRFARAFLGRRSLVIVVVVAVARA